jgi:hypothetical protein
MVEYIKKIGVVLRPKMARANMDAGLVHVKVLVWIGLDGEKPLPRICRMMYASMSIEHQLQCSI